MKILTLFMTLFSLTVIAQIDLKQPFKDCNIEGSITIYNYKSQEWIISDSVDANKKTLPASTFKIINLLIALETGVIKDENEVVKWDAKTAITYGNRPEIYKDMTVKEAFEKSAGWVFIELAKRIGKDKYKQYLKECNYGNQDLSVEGIDFWNLGNLGISPINQITLLNNVYEERVPFSKKNLDILKRVMITEETDNYIIRSKTGWTQFGGNDTGWWVGYVESNNNVYFFATRLIKKREISNPNFGECRKEITKNVLKQIKAIE